MERQPSTLKETTMTRTTRRLTARLATGVAAGLLTVGVTGAPATALRLVPVDPPTAVSVSEPTEDPSLLLTMGRVSVPTGTPSGTDTGPVSGTGDELLMSSGRLPR
jgi:hypothetical protein